MNVDAEAGKDTEQSFTLTHTVDGDSYYANVAGPTVTVKVPVEGAPGAPTGLTAQAGNQIATLTWAAPAKDGGSRDPPLRGPLPGSWRDPTMHGLPCLAGLMRGASSSAVWTAGPPTRFRSGQVTPPLRVSRLRPALTLGEFGAGCASESDGDPRRWPGGSVLG